MTVKIAAGKTDRGWRAGAIMLQRLPEIGGQALGDREESEEIWRRAVIFMSSAKDGELLDKNLQPNDLLFRLFHEDGVVVFEPVELKFACRCNEGRLADVLMTLPPEDLENCKVDGKITSSCEFCASLFEFDDEKLDYYRSLSA